MRPVPVGPQDVHVQGLPGANVRHVRFRVNLGVRCGPQHVVPRARGLVPHVAPRVVRPEPAVLERRADTAGRLVPNKVLQPFDAALSGAHGEEGEFAVCRRDCCRLEVEAAVVGAAQREDPVVQGQRGGPVAQIVDAPLSGRYHKLVAGRKLRLELVPHGLRVGGQVAGRQVEVALDAVLGVQPVRPAPDEEMRVRVGARVVFDGRVAPNQARSSHSVHYVREVVADLQLVAGDCRAVADHVRHVEPGAADDLAEVQVVAAKVPDEAAGVKLVEQRRHWYRAELVAYERRQRIDDAGVLDGCSRVEGEAGRGLQRVRGPDLCGVCKRAGSVHRVARRARRRRNVGAARWVRNRVHDRRRRDHARCGRVDCVLAPQTLPDAARLQPGVKQVDGCERFRVLLHLHSVEVRLRSVVLRRDLAQDAPGPLEEDAAVPVPRAQREVEGLGRPSACRDGAWCSGVEPLRLRLPPLVPQDAVEEVAAVRNVPPERVELVPVVVLQIRVRAVPQRLLQDVARGVRVQAAHRDAVGGHADPVEGPDVRQDAGNLDRDARGEREPALPGRVVERLLVLQVC